MLDTRIARGGVEIYRQIHGPDIYCQKASYDAQYRSMMHVEIPIDGLDEKLRAVPLFSRWAKDTSLKNAASIKRLRRVSPGYTRSSDHLQR